jgi:hypothetical protein
MPGRTHSKHVRFDLNDSPPRCSTPSLSWSPSSSPTSPGPLTPPPLKYGPSPLPPVPVVINPVLGLNMDYRGYNAPPVMTWNLTEGEDTIVHTGTPKPLRSRTLDEPATHPPLPRLVIMHPHLPWPIPVQPSRCAYVTVYDVLHTLYRSLRSTVSAQEFRSNPDSKRVTLAFQRRCANSSRRSSEEREKGVKRVDFLLERTRWVGLSSTKGGPDVWVLNTCPW